MYSFAFGGDIVRYFMRYRDKLDSRADIMNHSGLSPGDRAVLRSLYPLQHSAAAASLPHLPASLPFTGSPILRSVTLSHSRRTER